MPTNRDAYDREYRPPRTRPIARRDLLKKAVILPAAIAAAHCGAKTSARAEAAPSAVATGAADQTLPQIRLGKHSISRLVCGANPFNGGSHLSVFVSREMKSYYTAEQIAKTLRRCQEVGINCFQDSVRFAGLYRQFIEAGGKMSYINIAAGSDSQIKTLADAGCIAIAHHGEVTDRLFKTGRLDKVNEYLKKVRDAGLLVGVSTHMPDVVDAIESKGWDLDYYMTCIYERHRSEADLVKLLGQAPIPVGEVYLPNDPPRMFKAIRQTTRTCLAFKILAAGRLSDRKQWVERAFSETFASIKPTDGVIVGIYDRYEDQPAINAALVRRYGAGVKASPAPTT